MIVKYNDDSNLLLRQNKQLINYALHELTWGSGGLMTPGWIFGEEFSGGGVGENLLYIVFV